MKTVHLYPNYRERKDERLILLCYWFVNNKHNRQVIPILKELQDSFGDDLLRIVGLNPFNSQEEVENFTIEEKLIFENEPDNKCTGMFYQVNTYPTFILMERNGKILHRQDGFSDSCLEEVESIIKTGGFRSKSLNNEPTSHPEYYREKQSLKYLNR